MAKEDEIQDVPIGVTVHVPASVFSTYEAPPIGYWEGQTCRTGLGGKDDVGIKIPGEQIFTRPKKEVSAWVQVSTSTDLTPTHVPLPGRRVTWRLCPLQPGVGCGSLLCVWCDGFRCICMNTPCLCGGAVNGSEWYPVTVDGVDYYV